MRRDRKPLPKKTVCIMSGKARWPDRMAALAVVRKAVAARHLAEMDGLTSTRGETRAWAIHTTTAGKAGNS